MSATDFWRASVLLLLAVAAYAPLLPYAGASEDLYVVGRAAMDSPQQFVTLFNWPDQARSDAEMRLLADGGIFDNFLLADGPCKARFFRPLSALTYYWPMHVFGDRLPLLASLSMLHLAINAMLLAGCVRPALGPRAALAAGAGYLFFTPNTTMFGFLASHSVFWWHTVALATVWLLLRLPDGGGPRTFLIVLGAGTIMGLGFREFAVVQPAASVAMLALIRPDHLTSGRLRGAWCLQAGLVVMYGALSRALGWGACYAVTTLALRDPALALRTLWRTVGLGFLALATNGSLLGLNVENADRLAPVATVAAAAGLALLVWCRPTRPLAIVLVALLTLVSDTLLGGRGLAAAGFLVPAGLTWLITRIPGDGKVPRTLPGRASTSSKWQPSFRWWPMALALAWLIAWVYWVWIERDPYTLRVHRAAKEMAAAVSAVLAVDPHADTVVLLAGNTGTQNLALAQWTKRALGWPAGQPGPRLIVPFVITAPIDVRWLDAWTVRLEPKKRNHVMDSPGSMANALVYTHGLPEAGWKASAPEPFAAQRFFKTKQGAVGLELAFDRRQAGRVYAAWIQGSRPLLHRPGEVPAADGQSATFGSGG